MFQCGYDDNLTEMTLNYANAAPLYYQGVWARDFKPLAKSL